jgi:UDP-arabinose 4-epimerase
VNILVTGGAGYIGSHTCKALAQAGVTPVSLDNLVYGHQWAVRWGPLERGDIADRAMLDDVMRRYRPQAVMHFAAYAYVGESVQDPGKYYRNNVAGTLTLLEAMRDHAVGAVVFSSTCATYGCPTALPIREDHPQHPVNPYGASKLMVERMLRDFDAAHGIRSISLRYFNAAGADPAGEIGESHDPETHLIPLLLEAADGRRPALTIYGEDYDTPDGTCIRDYIHVSDLADAHVLALRSLLDGAGTTAFNLGNGEGFSVRQVVERARAVTKKDIRVIIGARRVGDPPVLVADATRALETLGWRPKHTSLDDSLETAWRWLRSGATL